MSIFDDLNLPELTEEDQRRIDDQADAEWLEAQRTNTCFQCGPQRQMDIDTAGDRVCPDCGYRPGGVA